MAFELHGDEAEITSDEPTRVTGALKESIEGTLLRRALLRLAASLQMSERRTATALRRATTVKSLRSLYARWSDRLIDQEVDARMATIPDDRPLPKGPIPDNLFFTAVRTVGELRAEAAVMNNETGQFIEHCLEGQYFIYRMLAPVRATLVLEFTECCLEIHQVRGPRAGKLNEADYASAYAWIDESGPVTPEAMAAMAATAATEEACRQARLHGARADDTAGIPPGPCRKPRRTLP